MYKRIIFLVAFILISLCSSAQRDKHGYALPGSDEAAAIDFYIKGSAKYFKKDFEEAIEDLTKAVELDPFHYRAWQFRASCKSALGDIIGAVRDYTEAIKAEPNEAGSYQMRGEEKYYIGDYRGALQDFNRAIEIHPTPGAYTDRAKAKFKLKDYAGCLKDCDLAIQGYPTSADAHYYRGFAKWQLGDKEGACLDWSVAGENGEDHAYEMIKKHCN